MDSGVPRLPLTNQADEPSRRARVIPLLARRAAADKAADPRGDQPMTLLHEVSATNYSGDATGAPSTWFMPLIAATTASVAPTKAGMA